VTTATTAAAKAIAAATISALWKPSTNCPGARASYDDAPPAQEIRELPARQLRFSA